MARARIGVANLGYRFVFYVISYNHWIDLIFGSELLMVIFKNRYILDLLVY